MNSSVKIFDKEKILLFFCWYNVSKDIQLLHINKPEIEENNGDTDNNANDPHKNWSKR